MVARKRNLACSAFKLASGACPWPEQAIYWIERTFGGKGRAVEPTPRFLWTPHGSPWVTYEKCQPRVGQGLANAITREH